MSPWVAWSDAAFARAREQKKPILAATGPLPPESLKAAAGEIESRFVAVLVDPETRPDAAARLGGDAVVLDSEGARRAVVSGAAELGRLAELASAPLAKPDAGPAWTGAVREDSPAAGPDAAAIAAVFSRLESLPAEALLHAAGERGDAAAREAAVRVLSAEAEPPALSARARRVALLWDAHALTGDAALKAKAAEASERLLRAHWDAQAGAFRRAPAPEPAVFPAEGNALAASALLRAHAFGQAGAGDAALKALSFVQNRLYDPLLGLLHAAGGEGENVCGLLGDAAPAALAFTDGYLLTGLKSQREFADALLRFLFQELWEREAGGFLDRVARAGDPLILREPRVDPGLNAQALELCRRLHHLKGNHNYRRWLEWGLRGAWPAAGGEPARAAGLARVADLHVRGRMDFELVGRPGESRADALLAAAHRLYLPRKTISFVDPDDQDYILAHKLEADSYPRLFGCGSDLRRLADAGEPAGVPAVAEAVRRAGA